jgi:sulfate/thiosulfate transport system ATP-binding protein
VQQIGTPDHLYEQPASDFVMGFLGPVTTLRGRLVRPHDLALTAEPVPGSVPAVVDRVVRLGFEVRVDATADGGEPVWAQVTREDARRLALRAGDTVHVRQLDPEPQAVAG